LICHICVSKLSLFFRDRHLDIVPALDVDSNVGQHHLTQMWPIFQELLAVFPSLSYVHVGPRLANLLVQPDNLDLNVSANDTIETDMSEIYKPYSCLQELWHLLNLNSSTTLLLCSNGLHSRSEFHNIPTNIILVEYGFQVFNFFLQSFHNNEKERIKLYKIYLNKIQNII